MEDRAVIRSAASLALGVVLVASVQARANPQPMTRDQIVALSQSGMGYSYYWGHGSWRTDGQSPGSCSGTCPSCSHTGQYGADCSGFVAKVWQVPSPSPVDVDQHPYSSYNFTYDSTWWNAISRGAAQVGDAFAYNSNGAGHVFIYESGDPWGSAWAYECKGCGYGCVHDLRTVYSYYGARERDLIVTAAGPDGGASAESDAGLASVDAGSSVSAPGDVGDPGELAGDGGPAAAASPVVGEMTGCGYEGATVLPSMLVIVPAAFRRRRTRKV